jgi:hypothetical protein
MATTTPNFGWPVPTSTDLVKDGATAIEALGDSIDASLLDLKGGTTGQVLSKTTNTDMDFTWVTSDDANAIQNTIVDAKGDLIGATAADTPARLAVGTNGQVLTADSTAATGLAWATPSSGGAMTLITRSSFSNVASVTYDSVFSATYGSYLIVFETFYAATEADDILMQLRYGSTTETSGTYRYVSIATASNTSTITGLNSGASVSNWMLADQSGNAAEPSRGHFIIPNAGAVGVAAMNGQIANISASRYSNFNGSLYTSRTYTGFILSSSASNITGTVAIYGMKVA